MHVPFHKLGHSLRFGIPMLWAYSVVLGLAIASFAVGKFGFIGNIP